MNRRQTFRERAPEPIPDIDFIPKDDKKSKSFFFDIIDKIKAKPEQPKPGIY